ncbi:hypothetical protein BLL36_18925 [Pseudomonas cedrina subsp. cedrina]|uniref:Uncharacterized protein n=1 Tax=Pseudomonas cedrina subsp. cedrina TaxID=76762 RepID=A0A1V2K399_PSECE|nr:hypothetical protein BLL36_18925 [Pseudomonas cedrina subsp. cedrina]
MAGVGGQVGYIEQTAKQLVAVAAFGPTRLLLLTGYISVIWVTAAIGSALTAGHFGKAPK